MKKEAFSQRPAAQFFAALIIYYLIIIIFFNKLVFQPYDLASAPDYISGVVIINSSEKLAQSGPPLWTPYFCGGMPCLASLQHPLFTYPVFNWDLLQKFIAVIFINPLMDSNLRLMLFHLLMAGIFTYLLARSSGLSWSAGLFAGLVYMFTPQLIVLPNVGHGSKLFSASYLPLVFLTVKRALERRKLADFALLVLSLGMTLLSLHVQMAFYALLAAGMFLVWSIIFDIKGKPLHIPLKVVIFSLAIFAGICFAASAYFPIYEYSPYSIRGGAEQGLEWDYATKWSFHPLESLTYIIPSFFGFGGQTYWGYMPFTDMPLYWGISALILAILAVVLARDRLVWFLIILFLFSWIVSFGNFLPILYKPMFEIMPFFNRFRVPVMIQILMVFSVAVLAGIGLDKVKELSQRKDFPVKRIMYAIIAVISVALIITVFKSPLTALCTRWVSANRGELLVQNYGVQQAEQIVAELSRLSGALAFKDLWKSAIFASGILAGLYALGKKKVNFSIFFSIATILLLMDLWMVNAKLINPTAHTNLRALLKPTAAVEYLQGQPKPFRIFPLDRTRPQNWYGYFGLENIEGYMGTKMKRYQQALDGLGLDNFNFINMMNAKYILYDKPLPEHPILQLVYDGEQKIYLNKNALPRAWIVHNLVTLPNMEDRFQYMKTFNPWITAVVEEPLSIPEGQGGGAEISEYTPLEIKVQTFSPTEALLVLSEVYYPPYWKAKIDGKETKIYPTNHLLRGVKIPAGEHTVVFNCDSSVYRLGWAVHYLATGGLLLVFVIALAPKVRTLLKRK